MLLTFMKSYQQYKNAMIPHSAEPEYVVPGMYANLKVCSRMPHTCSLNDLVIDHEYPSVDINMREKVKKKLTS